MNLPSKDEIFRLPEYTKEKPIKILISACLGGEKCGVDGTSNGQYPWIVNLMSLPNVLSVKFCPEQFSFGTPRDLPDIHGGNGFDVLDGKARVLSHKSEDMTSGMLIAAKEMLRIATQEKVDLAILMDMSSACGSQVISDGYRLASERKYQKGPGVASALLMRNGIRVISQRDFRTLEYLYKKLNPSHQIDIQAVDHHENEWYRNYFGA